MICKVVGHLLKSILWHERIQSVIAEPRKEMSFEDRLRPGGVDALLDLHRFQLGQFCANDLASPNQVGPKNVGDRAECHSTRVVENLTVQTLKKNSLTSKGD